MQLMLMKRGGRLIYAGPLGYHSCKVIQYFQAIPGVPRIKENYNPSTWMLEATSTSTEAQLGIDFAQIYKDSSLFQERFAGMYSPWAYSFAQVAMEIPYVFVQIVLFMFISYPMIGSFFTDQLQARQELKDHLEYKKIYNMATEIPMGNIADLKLFPSCSALFKIWWREWKKHVFCNQDLTITPPTVSNSGKLIKYGRTANNPIIGFDAPTPTQILSGRGLKQTSQKTVRKVPIKRKDGPATHTTEQ
ncbi:hypothetical protein PR202_gb00787 [Eleusine coracana subsp. coracana]|uniref:ABC-2 type transporter transmembrane domain-containing protein n=1 Tax=Eleusine coracana subsp. coracana TaxID=191504 RepID=A0AAV5DV06_ELECO|nr:hypothetical protein PR202_gb00787 [Eleusine coracana subsp. coracana]